MLSLTRQRNPRNENVAGYWPSLVVLIPNVVLVSILLTTYQARKGAGAGNNLAPPESQDGPTPLAKDPPSEGSVDYFANLVSPPALARNEFSFFPCTDLASERSIRRPCSKTSRS
jgi:hypothetical protein